MNLLKFCRDLYHTYKLNNDDYQSELVDKSFELGKKTRQKVLVLDMDETMISAKFQHHAPHNFIASFDIDYHGQTILIRKRPYL